MRFSFLQCGEFLSEGSRKVRTAFLGLGLISLFCLSGCGGLESDACSVANQTGDSGGGLSCKMARSERASLFSGDDFPRLWSGDPERKQPNVDPNALQTGSIDKAASTDRPAGADQPPAVDAGSQKASDASNDIKEIRSAGGTTFDPDEMISINFNHATMDFVLKQILGGALGVNYMAPDNLGGSVTFKLNAPVRKAQLLQIVRDILARNGLAMVYVNGVYHIGTSENLRGLATAGEIPGDVATVLVRVRPGSARDILDLARNLVPPEISMQASASNDSILVRASAADLEEAKDMFRTLEEDGAGRDHMAVVRVRRQPADLLTNQVQAFYQGRLGKAADLSMIPLVPQQAILVGTRDQDLLQSVRTLIGDLDRADNPEASIRVIQLVYLSANDVASQITGLFGAQTSAVQASGSTSSSASSPQSARSPYGGLGGGSLGAQQAGGPASSAAPSSSSGGGTSSLMGQSGAGQSSAQSGSGGASGTPSSARGPEGATRRPATPTAADQGSVKIIPDSRNNALVVYSAYDTFVRIKQIVAALDQPQAQVVIEATIADVALNDSLNYGVQWYLNNQGLTVRSSQSVTLTDPGSAGGVVAVKASIGNMSASVLLNALQSITTVKVLSSPYLTVVDGKEARLVIGTQIPYTTTTQNSSSNGVSTITNATTQLDTGVILDVTPKILSNNMVDLSIDQEVTDPAVNSIGGSSDPVINTRSVKSDVMALSGHTIILGGMIQENMNKTSSGVPIAQSLPILGHLFKTNSDSIQRSELLVLLTPRVVRQPVQVESLTRLLRNQIHIN